MVSELAGTPGLLRGAATSSSVLPADDVTAAATAPSTSGASTSRAWLLARRSSTWRIVRIALPRSPSTSTPSPLSACAIACADALGVGAEPPVRAAADGVDRDLRPAISPASSATPLGEVRAVRDDDDADQAALLVGRAGGSLNHRSRFDNAE